MLFHLNVIKHTISSLPIYSISFTLTLTIAIYISYSFLPIAGGPESSFSATCTSQGKYPQKYYQKKIYKKMKVKKNVEKNKKNFSRMVEKFPKGMGDGKSRWGQKDVS